MTVDSCSPQKTRHPFRMETCDNLPMRFYSMWPSATVRALEAEGVETPDDLSQLSEVTLLSYKGVGAHSLRQLRHQLSQHGLTFTGNGYRRKVGQPQSVLPSAAVAGVYFVRCEAYVKIGRAKNVRQRVQDAATFVPYPLMLVYLEPCSADEAGEREMAYHQRFAAHHHRREWFRYEGTLEAFLLERTA